MIIIKIEPNSKIAQTIGAIRGSYSASEGRWDLFYGNLFKVK